jgi:biotin synthase-related radical SAM superfamily protein
VAVSRVNVSIGTAGVLGLADVPMDVAPTTAYLMLGGRCSMACAFCAQARTSQAGALHLSRVTWPEFPLVETVDRLGQTVERGAIRRCCLQVTAGQDYFHRALTVIRAVKAVTDVPLDAAVLPPTMAHVAELMAAGLDHVGFGLDAASERVFQCVKGGDWARSLQLIEETARRYPGRAAAHLIVGLGETERETVGTIQTLHDWGATVGLFAFTPVRGTAMAHLPPPPLAAYRRMQAARHLIAHRLARVDDFTFSLDGRLVDFGLSGLSALLADGVAFQTSGCPDCNRPYYNERPGGPIYNYPRPLSQAEIERALVALNLKTSVQLLVDVSKTWTRTDTEEQG